MWHHSVLGEGEMERLDYPPKKEKKRKICYEYLKEVKERVKNMDKSYFSVQGPRSIPASN